MRKTYKKFYHDYLSRELKLAVWQKVGVMLLVVVIAGFVGWVYEFLVALVETGEVCMQGGNLLPWINIYAIGAVLLVPATYRFRKYPWAVFLIAVLLTGVVELVGGWLVYEIGNGTRYWNYDHGLWLVGNINGFVCLLSATFFGLGAMGLIYAILPMCEYVAMRWNKCVFLVVAGVLFGLVMVDEVANLTLKNLNQPTAMDLYRELGWKYQEF